MQFSNPFIKIFGAPVRPDTEAQTQPDNITSFALDESEMAFIHAIDADTYAIQEAYELGIRTVTEIFEKHMARLNQHRRKLLDSIIEKRISGGTTHDHDVSINLADRIVVLEPHKKEINTMAAGKTSAQVKSALQSALSSSKKTVEKEAVTKAAALVSKIMNVEVSDDELASEITKGLEIKDQTSAMELLKYVFCLEVPADAPQYSSAMRATADNIQKSIAIYAANNSIDPAKLLIPKCKSKLIDIVLDCFSIPKEFLEALKESGKAKQFKDPGAFIRKFLINTINTAFP